MTSPGDECGAGATTPNPREGDCTRSSGVEDALPGLRNSFRAAEARTPGHDSLRRLSFAGLAVTSSIRIGATSSRRCSTRSERSFPRPRDSYNRRRMPDTEGSELQRARYPEPPSRSRSIAWHLASLVVASDGPDPVICGVDNRPLLRAPTAVHR